MAARACACVCVCLWVGRVCGYVWVGGRRQCPRPRPTDLPSYARPTPVYHDPSTHFYIHPLRLMPPARPPCSGQPNPQVSLMQLFDKARVGHPRYEENATLMLGKRAPSTSRSSCFPSWSSGRGLSCNMSHPFERRWHMAAPSGPEAELGEMTPLEAGQELADFLITLKQIGRLSAKDVCVLCHYATIAGLTGPATEFSFLPHECLSEEIDNTPEMVDKLRASRANNEWPDAFVEHPVSRDAPPGADVWPLCLYVDGIPLHRRDGVLAFYAYNMISETRHLLFALRRSQPTSATSGVRASPGTGRRPGCSVPRPRTPTPRPSRSGARRTAITSASSSRPRTPWIWPTSNPLPAS